MRKALERLSAFEEATTGRIFSLKGLKVMGCVVAAAAVLDTVAIRLDRRADEAARAKMYEEVRRRKAAEVLIEYSTEEPTTQDIMPAETHIDQELKTEEAAHD